MNSPLNFHGNNFEEDLENFLTKMRSVDAELTKILEKNIGTLKQYSGDGSTANVRREFNSRVLDELRNMAKNSSNGEAN